MTVNVPCESGKFAAMNRYLSYVPKQVNIESRQPFEPFPHCAWSSIISPISISLVPQVMTSLVPQAFFLGQRLSLSLSVNNSGRYKRGRNAGGFILSSDIPEATF